MTKAERKLLQQREAALFLEKEQMIDWFGKASKLANGAVNAWLAVYEVLELLDLEADHNLPANKEAWEMQSKRSKLEAEEKANQEQMFEDYLETDTNCK